MLPSTVVCCSERRCVVISRVLLFLFVLIIVPAAAYAGPRHESILTATTPRRMSPAGQTDSTRHSPTAPIQLTVDAREAPRGIFHSHMVMPVSAGPLTLFYPEWIPGEHG